MPTDSPTSSSRQRHRTTLVRSIPRASLACLLLPIAISFLVLLLANDFDVVRDRSSDDERGWTIGIPTSPTDDYDYDYDDDAIEEELEREDEEDEEDEDGSIRRSGNNPNLAEILRGRVPFPADVDTLRYRPGDGAVGGLEMDSTEALRYCLVDDAYRTDHVRGGTYLVGGGGHRTFVSISDEYRLIYRHVPKSASRRVFLVVVVRSFVRSFFVVFVVRRNDADGGYERKSVPFHRRVRVFFSRSISFVHPHSLLFSLMKKNISPPSLDASGRSISTIVMYAYVDSSSRTAMTKYFRGKDAVVVNIDELENMVRRENYTLVSFVREPLDRFYSSYDEAILRWGPWIGSTETANRMPGVARYYRENRQRLEEHPYLYEGINTYEDYVNLFCHSSKKDGRCDEEAHAVPANGGLTLIQRFERFVSDYDGTRPFDNHLRCQVPYLVDGRDGLPLPVSTLYDAKDAEGGWRRIANGLGVVIPEGGLEVVRGAPRRFDTSRVSNATRERICRLVALDYCCLNIELPEVCRMRDDEGVYCAIRKSRKSSRLGTKFYIQPWNE